MNVKCHYCSSNLSSGQFLHLTLDQCILASSFILSVGNGT